MKKFLRYYLPVLIFLFASGILFLGYMFTNHLGTLKYFAGELGLEGKGKIITTKVNVAVKEDGIEQTHIRTFEDEGKLYLLFEKTENADLGVLIVDEWRKDIYLPVVGNCYDFLFSKYLIQTECAERGDYYLSERKGMYNVKFASTNSQIDFRLPAEYNNGKVIKSKQIEIIFRGE